MNRPIMRKNNQRGKASSSSSSSPSLSASVSTSSTLLSDICSNSGNSKLRRVYISNAGYLNSLPMEAFQCLTWMEIYKDEKLESLSEVEEVFRSCSSSLRSLSINCCSKLRSLRGGLEHLTALEDLRIEFANSLDMIEEEEEDCLMPWRSLQHSLRSLYLWFLPKLVELPKGMHYLTSLQSLTIRRCRNLKCLPEWGSCFSSLQSLKIEECENLEGLPEWVCSAPSLHIEIK